MRVKDDISFGGMERGIDRKVSGYTVCGEKIDIVTTIKFSKIMGLWYLTNA